MTLWHQLHFEGGVDIYQLAKLAHYNRPGILKSPEDLLFLYCALEVIRDTLLCTIGQNSL